MQICVERNYCYVPFEKSEHTLKHTWPTWQATYCFHETTIQTNEANFTYNINPTWGDMESAI